MRRGPASEDFHFSYLDEWRVAAEKSWNSGIIRSTAATKLFENESGFFGNEWHPKYAVVTNIGMFLFKSKDTANKDHKEQPEFLHWANFEAKPPRKAAEMADGKKNLLDFGPREEIKLYSVQGSQEELIDFNKKLNLMRQEFRKTKVLLSGVKEDI